MKTLNYVKIILLMGLVSVLVSCGDKYYSDDFLRNSDEKLCSNEWVNEYVTAEDKLYQQYLIFYKDGKGREKIRTSRRLENGNWDLVNSSEITIPFTWRWTDKTMEGIHMDFYREKEYYFDNVWIREHYMSGKLDDEHVTFIDSKYSKYKK